MLDKPKGILTLSWSREANTLKMVQEAGGKETKLMLTHIVCWKYKAETTPEMRADHRAKLMALPEIIRNSVSFNVGEDILHLERSFDTGLVAVFTDRAALDFYSDHPEHQKVAALGAEYRRGSCRSIS